MKFYAAFQIKAKQHLQKSIFFVDQISPIEWNGGPKNMKFWKKKLVFYKVRHNTSLHLVAKMNFVSIKPKWYQNIIQQLKPAAKKDNCSISRGLWFEVHSVNTNIPLMNMTISIFRVCSICTFDLWFFIQFFFLDLIENLVRLITAYSSFSFFIHVMNELSDTTCAE